MKNWVNITNQVKEEIYARKELIDESSDLGKPYRFFRIFIIDYEDMKWDQDERCKDDIYQKINDDEYSGHWEVEPCENNPEKSIVWIMVERVTV